MQAMTLKGNSNYAGGNTTTNGRPKSIDKTSVATSKVIAQPIVMKQSQSKVNVTQQDCSNNAGSGNNGSQSRERQQRVAVQQMISEQAKNIPSTTSSRNNAKGINAQLNTQNSLHAKKVPISQSFYSNQSAISYQ